MIEDTEDLSSAEGLAGDEALAISVGRGEAPPTLHLYQYKPAVIVGRYQNLTDAVDLDECVCRGHEWNRRHTGGGTVLMGPDQVAIALALPEVGKSSMATIRMHFEFFSDVLAYALSNFGIKAELMGKNDLSVDGRKVAGLAISQDIDGCAFLHCSLLLDFDVALMVDLLHLSTRELDDKGQSCFAQRMTTLREHAPCLTTPEIRRALVRSLERAMKTSAVRSNWTANERTLIDELKHTRYENEEWIYSSRVMRRWSGTAEHKTPGGNLRVYVDRNGGVLDAVLITGDYFTRDLDLARLESSLRFIPAELDRIQQALEDQECDAIYRVTNSELAQLILAAAQDKTAGSRILAS